MGKNGKQNVRVDLVPVILNNAKELCKQKNIPIKDLAAACHVSEGYFGKPHNDIAVSKLLAMGELFDIAPEKLWDRGFTAKIRVQALKAEIERMEAEIDALQMESQERLDIPFGDAPVKK